MRPLRRAIENANRAASHADQTLGLADSLLIELKDGVQLELVRTGDNSIMDFFTGKCDKLPIAIKLVIDE